MTPVCVLLARCAGDVLRTLLQPEVFEVDDYTSGGALAEHAQASLESIGGIVGCGEAALAHEGREGADGLAALRNLDLAAFDVEHAEAFAEWDIAALPERCKG